MVYYNRSTIYLSSVGITNIPKTTYYIFFLMNMIVEKVEEENVVQIVIDNEISFKEVVTKFMSSDFMAEEAFVEERHESWSKLPSKVLSLVFSLLLFKTGSCYFWCRM